MSKIEADDLFKISTSFLKKHGYFKNWLAGTIASYSSCSGKSSVSVEVVMREDGGCFRIQFIQNRGTNEETNFDHQIPLTTTPCRFGGRRYWFKCTLYKNDRYCGKRVGVLYKRGDYLACRHCFNLTYSSRNENRRHVPLFPQFGIMDIEKKIAEQQKRVKVPYYRGRPTKQQRKLDRLWDEYVAFAKRYNLLE